MKLTWLDITALVLVIVGGLNWGLAVFNFNLVNQLLGGVPTLEMIVYGVVGLAAIYVAMLVPKLSKGQ